VRTGTRRLDGATAALARGAGSTADLAGVHETPRLGEPALRGAAGHPERPTDTQEPANTPAGRLPCHAQMLDDACRP